MIRKYHLDQKLKHEIFQVIGDIETSLNNEISYILGKSGPYSYLDFESWCQNRGRNRYLGTVIRRHRNIGVKIDKYKNKSEELNFLSQLQHQVKKSSNIDIQAFEEENSNKIFPNVWLMVNTLTFGQSIYLAKLMLPEKRNELTNKFFHSRMTHLVKNLELLNLIRNICCHNGDLADISLKTMPKISNRYNEYLNMINGNYPHRLAIVVTVLLDLVYSIDDEYDFENPREALIDMCKVTGKKNEDGLAQNMGFRDVEAVNKLISSFKKPRTITFYPQGGYVYD